MITSTYEKTYTKVDVHRVIDCFAADYDMITQATGLGTQQQVTNTVHDLKILAAWGYIDRIDIVARNAHGDVRRAARYTVSTNASLWQTQRPGDTLWPRLLGGSLSVVISYTPTWRDLGAERQRAFKRDYLRIAWVPSSIDLSYPGLVGHADRRYASNAFGTERTTYR